jgi:hypothetical protein
MPSNSTIAQSNKLVGFILDLNGFQIYERTGAGYDHMGAIITDAVLQAGLNYKTVVAPRVQILIRRWPSASRTSTFASMIRRYGIKDVLNWRDDEKPRRIECLTEFFRRECIETEFQCRQWLGNESNLGLLRQVRGIGPKSIDYIKSLLGIPAVAVDRHIRTFIKWSGLSLSKYADIRDVVCEAAEILGCGHSALDHAIWRYMSSTRDRSTFPRAA